MPDDPNDANPMLSRPGLTGKAETTAGSKTEADKPETWVDRTHPDRRAWIEAERRQRASFIATRGELSRFLVPHRFEGDKAGHELRRAGFGFGIGLNAMFVNALTGHLRSAPASYTWGPLDPDGDGDSADSPAGGVAQRLWNDIDFQNTSWPNFFQGEVLEWMLTSPGGWLLVDSSSETGDGTQRRPTYRFFPWSAVEDYGWGRFGLRWAKLREMKDVREPRTKEQQKPARRHLLYELTDDGSSRASRYNDEAEQIGETVEMGRLVDFQGQPTLPLIPVGYGDHPAIDHVAAGLLLGLDDTVIDLYNQVSEVREGFRDINFAYDKYRGPDADTVRGYLEDGSRFVPLGEDPNAQLSRETGQTPEIQGGLAILEIALKAWALSARRKSIEAMEGASPRSGVSLQAEFQIDEKPLLRTIASHLDDVESMAMYLGAQLWDENLNAESEEARRIGVERQKDFNLEEEPSRITRLVEELRAAFGEVPSSQFGLQAFMRWAESSDLLDLETEVGVGGEDTEDTRVLRELVEEEAATFFDQRAETRRQAGQSRLPFEAPLEVG